MSSIRGMPWGIALFLMVAFLVLGGVGLALGPVVDQAILVPITLTDLDEPYRAAHHDDVL